MGWIVTDDAVELCDDGGYVYVSLPHEQVRALFAQVRCCRKHGHVERRVPGKDNCQTCYAEQRRGAGQQYRARAERVAQRYAAGDSARRIAVEEDIDPITVHNRLHAAIRRGWVSDDIARRCRENARRNRTNNAPSKTERNADIVARYASGVPAAQIAKHFGISRARVYWLLAKARKEGTCPTR